MLIEEVDNQDLRNSYLNSYSNKNIYVARDSLLESEMEKVLNDFLKSKPNMEIRQDSFKSIHINSIKNSTLYSQANKEFYLLVLVPNQEQQQQQKDKEVKQTSSNFLITFSLESNSVKSIKKLTFVVDSTNTQIENFSVEEFIINTTNENQVCFFNKEYIAFISDLKRETQTNNDLTIKIVHTSMLEKDQSKSQKFTLGIMSNKKVTNSASDYLYKKFKFSTFDNYFGVLFNNNSFRLYSIDSRVSKCVVSNIVKDIDIVDFSFGPNLDFSWLNFSVFFLDYSGGVHYICPIFPEEFTIKRSYLNKMTSFVRNLQIFESNKEKEKGEEALNENILIHLNKCSSSNEGDDEKVQIDDYLRNFNNKTNINNIITIDKRRNTDVLLVLKDSQNQVAYKNIHILNIYPLTFLRISNRNSIDVIVCFDDISPIRKTKNVIFSKEAYLVETIYMKNVSQVCEDLRNAEEYKHMNLRIMENHFTSNLKRNELISQTNNYCLYLNFLNDIYEIKFSYLKNLSDTFDNFTGRDDLKFDFKAKVNKILIFNYDLKESSNVKTYGYFGAEKFDNSFILISFLNKKLVVKDFSYDLYEEELNSFKSESGVNLNFNKLEKNLKKINMGMSMSLSEINDINFERLDQLANKALNSSSLADATIQDTIKHNPILHKQIILDEENLKKIPLENLDYYIKSQIDGIFDNYDAIFNLRSSNIKEKTKIFNKIIDNLNVANIPKLKAEVEQDRQKIDKLKNEVVNKKKLIGIKSNAIADKLFTILNNNSYILQNHFSLKKYLDNKKNDYDDLKKTSEEIKQEFIQLINETKDTQIIKEKFDHKLIDKELLKKQDKFAQNLKNLADSLRNASKKVETYFKPK